MNVPVDDLKPWSKVIPQKISRHHTITVLRNILCSRQFMQLSDKASTEEEREKIGILRFLYADISQYY